MNKHSAVLILVYVDQNNSFSVKMKKKIEHTFF